MSAAPGMLSRGCGLILVSLLATPPLDGQNRSLRLDASSNGPAILAVADTLTVTLHWQRCDFDVCERLPGSPRTKSYRSANDGIAAVSEAGVITARAPGRTVVEALTSEGTARIDVHVVPATKTIEWSTRAKQARVGDTLRVFLLARDSAGRIVARFPPEALIGGVGRVLNWDSAGRAVIVLDRPGRLVLASRLGGRTDTLTLQVR